MYTYLFLLTFSILPPQKINDKLVDECTYCTICKNKNGRDTAGRLLLILDYDTTTYKSIAKFQKKALQNSIEEWLNKNGTNNIQWYKDKLSNKDLAKRIVNDVENGNLEYDKLKIFSDMHVEIGKGLYRCEHYYSDFRNFLSYVLVNTNKDYGICGLCYK